jgi:glycosyltransferase
MARSESLKFSIITASYNRKEFIESCIASVLGQTFPDIEYIIIDGGSTDGTLEVIKKVVSQESQVRSREIPVTSHQPPVIKIISEPDNGIYDALNKGIRMATGDVIGFLHADDLYAKDTVLKTVAGCFERQNVDSCYGDLLYVDKNDTNKTVRCWKSSSFDSTLLKKGWMPPHPTFFVKRTVYEKYGGFDTTFKIAADYELMMRFLGKYGISTCYIPELLVKMRVGGASNRSISNIIRKSSEDFRIIRMHSIGGLVALLRKNLSKIPQFFKK